MYAHTRLFTHEPYPLLRPPHLNRRAAFATPSGLNNIPGPTRRRRALWIFDFLHARERPRADLNFGFKTGLDFKVVKFEMGAASHFLPDKGGPVPGWKAAGFAPTQEYFGNPPGSLPAEGHPEIALNIDDVLKYKDQPGYALVDARPINEYEGHGEIWLRKGHIPGAISFHWARLMEKDITHKFKLYAETKAALEAADITKDKDILCYCGTSREGSLLRFYLKHVADYPKVRLHEGAWKEYVWLKNKSLPAETEASKK